MSALVRALFIVAVSTAACSESWVRGVPAAPSTSCGVYPVRATSLFVLPYATGAAYFVAQANCGPSSHVAGGPFQFAYDFLMPIGTVVKAARGGRVLAVVEAHEDGNRTPGLENYVFVSHDDGTVGRYFHFTRDGALVAPGISVEAGMPIGLSGDTGASTAPHLHFDVARCPAVGCDTLPIVFRNTRSHPRGLDAGEAYVAFPF